MSFTGSTSVGEQDLLLFGANWGEGIARYIADLGGSGLDAGIDPRGDLQALTSYGGYFGYTHYWNQEWRSNLVYGYLRLDDEAFLSPDTFRTSQYSALRSRGADASSPSVSAASAVNVTGTPSERSRSPRATTNAPRSTARRTGVPSSLTSVTRTRTSPRRRPGRRGRRGSWPAR